jgi:hypothetical protein
MGRPLFLPMNQAATSTPKTPATCTSFFLTFVIVTHNTELADMADRKLEIKDGKIVN